MSLPGEERQRRAVPLAQDSFLVPRWAPGGVMAKRPTGSPVLEEEPRAGAAPSPCSPHHPPMVPDKRTLVPRSVIWSACPGLSAFATLSMQIPPRGQDPL